LFNLYPTRRPYRRPAERAYRRLHARQPGAGL